MNTGRGEEWVVGQIILLAAVVLAPLLDHSPTNSSVLFGLILLITSCVTVLLSIRILSASREGFPSPSETSRLAQTGFYGLVRHPIYTSLILIAAGWSLIWMSTIGLVLTGLLALCLDRKASWEEKRLTDKYPEYAGYRQHVRKRILWIY